MKPKQRKSMKKPIALISAGLFLLTLLVMGYILENIFIVLERTAVMSLKPIKTGVDKENILEHVPYSKRESFNRVNIFTFNKGDKRPVVVLLPGGNWQGGLPGNYKHLGGIIRRSGYVAFIPEIPPAYGVVGRALLSENTLATRMHPAQVNAVIELLQFIQNQAGQYGGDKDRISLLGTGSGSHLALIAALKPEFSRQASLSGRLKGVAAINPVTDLTLQDETFSQWFVKPAFGANAADLKQNSPVQYAKQASFPVLLLSPEFGPAYSLAATKEFYKALDQSGADVALHVVEQRAPRSIVFKAGRRGDLVEKKLKAFWLKVFGE